MEQPTNISNTKRRNAALLTVGLFSAALMLVAIQISAHGHEPPLPPPPDPPRDECQCSELFAEPQNKGRIKVTVKDTGEKIKVTVAVPWRGAITCTGAKKGACEGELELSSSSKSWMVNVAKDGTGGHTATTVGGELFRTSPGQKIDITCKGKCTGKEDKSPLTGATFTTPPPSIKKFNTVYEAEIKENDPKTNQTNLHIKGQITLEVAPSAATVCASKKGWKMILEINSALKHGFDRDTSDYDGDGFTNAQEKKAKTDLWDPNDKPKP